MPRARVGSVFRHGDHWDIQCTLPDGTRSARACQSAEMTEDEARAEALRLTRLAVKVGAVRIKDVATLKTELMADWIDRWLKEREERGLASVDDDRGRWKKWIAPHLAGRDVAKIQRIDLERVVEDLDKRVRGGELSWKTAQNVWGLVTKMFSDAKDSKQLDLRTRTDNPAKDVRGPDGGVVKSKSYLYPEELALVLSSRFTPLRWRQLFALAVYTYTRPGELGVLEWSDVDFDRRTIHIHRALDDDGETKSTKTKKPRRIPIEPALVPLLELMKKERSAPRVVASMPPECDLSKRLRDYLARAGVTRAELFANDATRKQITFYDLRATGITWMALRGDEPLRIMQRAGHERFDTTMGYVRSAEELGDVGEVFAPLPPPVLESLRESLQTTENPKAWGQLGGRIKKMAASPAGFEPA